jgi:MFS family permease
VSALFPQALWNRVFGALAGVWGAATLVSPLIGGLFAEAGFWRGAFWLFALQGLVFIAAAWRLVRPKAAPETEAAPGGPAPLLQVLILALAVGGVGSAALAWLAFVKFVLGEAIGGRPLLLIGVVCVLAAIQLVTTGVLAEILLRMGGEGGRRASYVLDPRYQDQPAGWQAPC